MPIPKPKEPPKVLLGIALVLLVIATVLGLYLNSRAAGQAITVGEEPLLGEPINLVNAESITFTSPGSSRSFVVSTVTKPYDTTILGFDVSFTKRDDGRYSFLVKRGDLLIAQDVLEDNQRFPVYLTENDALADLEISYLQGSITVRNLHYVAPEQAVIGLYKRNETGEVVSQYPPIVLVSTGSTFRALVNASSSFPPGISVSVPAAYTTALTVGSETRVPSQNYTSRPFTFTAPSQPAAVLLKVAATVQDLDTFAYYRLAVGGKAYELQETGHPVMTVTLKADGSAEVKAIFRESRELQPFSVPCTPAAPLSTMFSGKDVRRILSYGGAPLIWNPPPGASDFIAFEQFKGYFVQFRGTQPDSEAARTITFTCSSVPALQLPAYSPPALSGLQSIQFPGGWSLFSLPGAISRSLTEFTSYDGFRILECNQGNVCQDIDRATLLEPGKVYWIASLGPFAIGFRTE